MAITRPSPAPYRVTLIDPVPGRFTRAILLTSSRSVDKAFVSEDDCDPAVTTTRRISEPSVPTKHLEDVSEPHSVASHEVWPTRDIDVRENVPSPLPYTVTLAEPVPKRLVDSPELTTTIPKETASDSEADTLPTETATCTLCETDEPARHRADVSDSHSVPSHAV